jgi:hypothetical protein
LNSKVFSFIMVDFMVIVQLCFAVCFNPVVILGC